MHKQLKVARVNEKDMGTDLESVLITKEEIDAKLVELAAKIDAEYAGKDSADRRRTQGRRDGDGGPGPCAVLAGHHGLDGGVLLRRGHHSPPAWSGSSRTSTPTSRASTS